MRISPASVSRSAEGWTIDWRIANDQAGPVEIKSAWLPHSGFRSDERPVDRVLKPGEELRLLSTVAWDGAEVNNAFLILRLADRKLFARLHVTPAGVEVEAVTYTGES